MLNIFNSLISTNTTTSTTITLTGFTLCIVSSIIFGLITSKVFQYKNITSKSFLITLGILPAVVCVVIMMVNGSIGAGIAVAGAFSLVRFRSIPGTAKEISAIFIAMATGLACGMGYVGYGFIFTIIISIVIIILEAKEFGNNSSLEKNKIIKITIPEDLNYEEIFDDIFEKYTNKHRLEKVKTSNMGSMFKLSYVIELKEHTKEKEFIDELRIRNGNLEICSSIQSANNSTL